MDGLDDIGTLLDYVSKIYEIRYCCRKRHRHFNMWLHAAGGLLILLITLTMSMV